MKIIRQKSVGVGIYLKKMVGGWFLEFRSAHPLQFSGIVPPLGFNGQSVPWVGPFEEVWVSLRQIRVLFRAFKGRRG